MKHKWGMAIASLDSTGHMAMLHKLDNTQYGSILVAEDKARSVLDFRRSTKVFEGLVAQGGIGLRTLGLRGASPLEGDLPIIVDGTIIGAIDISGATSSQDGQVAKAGADAAKWTLCRPALWFSRAATCAAKMERDYASENRRR